MILLFQTCFLLKKYNFLFVHSISALGCLKLKLAQIKLAFLLKLAQTTNTWFSFEIGTKNTCLTYDIGTTNTCFLTFEIGTTNTCLTFEISTTNTCLTFEIGITNACLTFKIYLFLSFCLFQNGENYNFFFKPDIDWKKLIYLGFKSCLV